MPSPTPPALGPSLKLLFAFLLLFAPAASLLAQDSLDVYLWKDGVANVRALETIDSMTFQKRGANWIDASAQSVDLGLSVEWGACNLGATAPEGYGNHYAWGETRQKVAFTAGNYKWGSGTAATKYNNADHKTTLDPSDDAATATLGKGWRTPTLAEWEELSERCTWTWTERNGTNGFLVTARNGNSIFLPAAGYQWGGDLNDEGLYGSYWSSSLIASGSDVRCLDFVGGRRLWCDTFYRYCGQSVRPVRQ